MTDAERARRTRRLVAAGIAVALVLLALAPASVLSAWLAPVRAEPARASTLAVDRNAPDRRVRALPAGLPDGVAAEAADATLDRQARLALGAAGAERLQTYLGASVNLPSTFEQGFGSTSYPGTIPAIERLLDAAPDDARTAAAAQLGALLIVLAGRSDDDAAPVHPSAGAIAYALLDRSRTLAGCDAETDLLVLLAADNQPHDDVVATQAATAEQACPDDPTPGWVLGEFRSLRARVATRGDLEQLERELPTDAVDRPLRTATALQQRFPGSGDVASLVGDVQLRLGRELGPSEPFTARGHLEDAVAAYAAAESLGGGRTAVAGRAQALQGLARPGEAVALLTPLTTDAAVTHLGPARLLLLQAQQDARDFAAAAGTAAGLVSAGGAGFVAQGWVVPREPAVSVGLDETVALNVDVAPCCGGSGGADVDDYSFLPTSRPDPGVVDHLPAACAALVEVRADVLSGHPDAALAALPTTAETVRPGGPPCSGDGLDQWRQIARGEAGQPVTTSTDVTVDGVFDARQNLWRWAGDLERAAAVALAWDEATGGRESLPTARLAEIRHLQGHDDEAAALFEKALRLAQNGYRIDLAMADLRLERGAVLIASGRQAEGNALLRTLAADLDTVEAQFRLGFSKQAPDEVTAHAYALRSYYTRLQLGDQERRSDSPLAAVEDYAAAQDRLPLEKDDVTQVVPGVLDNDQALALAALDRPEDARAAAEQAVAADPESPVFLLTAGSVAHAADDSEAAAVFDEEALAQDPTAFPAANDLGVALADQGHPAMAARAFRRAVEVRDDYATGWFNLAVLDSRRGPLHVLQAQGAYARAFELDPALEEEPRTLTADEHVYRTGLDESAPLPPAWSFARVEQRQPLGAVGLLAVLGLVAAAGTAAGSQVSRVLEHLESATERLARLPLLRRRRRTGWALVATVATFGLATVWESKVGITAALVFLAGIALLGAWVVLVREVVASRMGVRLVHRNWPPGLVLGVATGAVGLPLAPLPYVRAPAAARRIHVVAPIALFGLTLLLLLEAVVWGVPVTRALAVAAATMTASVLLPLRPMDGGALGGGRLFAAVAAVVGLLLAVGVAE